MDQTAKLKLMAEIVQYGEINAFLALEQAALTPDPGRVGQWKGELETSVQRIRAMLDAI
jgi:hypothetical protein